MTREDAKKMAEQAVGHMLFYEIYIDGVCLDEVYEWLREAECVAKTYIHDNAPTPDIMIDTVEMIDYGL